LDIPRDRWSGFRKERSRLLSLLASEGVENVYFLAGDLHSSHAIKATLAGPGGRALPVWEFCSTPFEQTPNRYARLLYRQIKSASVTRVDCRFIVMENNFGLVRVNFDTSGRPQVTFDVYSERGELLHSVTEANQD
jgi:hypothetical protein